VLNVFFQICWKNIEGWPREGSKSIKNVTIENYFTKISQNGYKNVRISNTILNLHYTLHLCDMTRRFLEIILVELRLPNVQQYMYWIKISEKDFDSFYIPLSGIYTVEAI